MVNHSLANNLNAIATASSIEEVNLGGEVVAFAIIEKPFISITTGANATWTMDLSVRSNYAFMPKIWDTFSRSLDLSKEIEPDFGEEFNRLNLTAFGKRKPQMYKVSANNQRMNYSPLPRLNT